MRQSPAPFPWDAGLCPFSRNFQTFYQNSMTIVGFLDTNFTKIPCGNWGSMLRFR
ncbi:hypothetical protein FAEPRAA2165_01512 [Faecalibacterium duncaniae]|uniref:Uncharacterized protein n=1 Tax=Faecalibacterium duncaniae (strain DSM 17677 / JCM 31915 / A2-165) TaxID=411483 RepID=C7H5E2_FAED2|nr:hypothetical protein FAEPRAA2165_01512 [Faecalibacterium duncaniae]